MFKWIHDGTGRIYWDYGQQDLQPYSLLDCQQSNQFKCDTKKFKEQSTEYLKERKDLVVKRNPVTEHHVVLPILKLTV